MAKNQVSIVITDEQINSVFGAIDTIKANIPGLITLTKAERASLNSMGDKTVEFVNKATAYGNKNVALVPGFIDRDEQDRDVQTVNQLKEVRRQLDQLSETVDDTLKLAGSEALSGALAIYHTIKNAAKNRVEGAKTAYDDLRARFPGRRGNTPFYEQLNEQSE